MSSKASSLISFTTLIILISILYIAGFDSSKKQQEIVKLQAKIIQLKKQNENILIQTDDTINKTKEQIGLVSKTLDENKAILEKKEKDHKEEQIKQQDVIKDLQTKNQILTDKINVLSSQLKAKPVLVKKSTAVKPRK